jgi:predicted Zn-dependent peptidase
MARQEIYFGRQFTLDEILDNIETVSAGDVQNIAAHIFKGELAVSVLGNLGRYRPKAAHLRV